MIKINNVKPIDAPVFLFDKEGKCLGELKTHEQYLDILIQIKKEKAEGYYLIFKDKKIFIDSDGTLSEYTEGLFDKVQKLLFNLAI